MLYSLWQSKAFYQFLRGSVIQFVILWDVNSCLLDGLEKMEANPDQFKKTVEALRSLEAMEIKFRQNIKLVQDAKRMLFYKYL